jgi:hypothetical protein
MGYMRDLEHELREMLDELPEEEVEPVIKFVKEKVYESYQNGQGSSTNKHKKNKDS